MQQLLRFAAGWIGWTSEQALREDLEYISAAYEGRAEMLQAIFGGAPNKTPGTKSSSPASISRPRLLTPADFDRAFGLDE